MHAEIGVSQEIRSIVRDHSGESQEEQLEYSGIKGEGLNGMGNRRAGQRKG